MSYKELAFKATVVDEFREENLLAINNNGVYYETENGIKKFANEHKALEYILNTLKINTKYILVDVFYNPSYAEQEKDKLKYNDYILVMARKTVAVNNQILNYLISPDDSGELFYDTKNNTLDDERDLDKIQGLGLDLIMQDEKDGKFDIRDNFIYQVLDKDFTCNSLFKHIKEQQSKVRGSVDIALIDVTGSELKSTINDGIIVDDALDIYREFLGGTIKTEEEFNKKEIEEDNEKNKNKPNDSEYV